MQPAGGLWLTGEPAARGRGAGRSSAQALAGRRRRRTPAEAGLHVYAGGDLAALAEAVRAARPRLLAALLPEALELDAWRVPGLSGAVTRAEDLPALVASLLPPEARGAGLPAARRAGPVRGPAIARTSRAAALAGLRAADHEAAGAALVPLEAKLILQIAAANGQKIDQSRMPELLVGAAAGDQLRQLAARAGSSRTARALAAAGGTQALGRAAFLRYARASSPD